MAARAEVDALKRDLVKCLEEVRAGRSSGNSISSSGGGGGGGGGSDANGGGGVSAATADRVRDILAALNAVTVTRELLKATKIGKVVTECRRDIRHEELSRTAMQLVDKWKKQIGAAGGASKKAAGTSAGAAKAKAKAAESAAAAPAAAAASEGAGSGAGAGAGAGVGTEAPSVAPAKVDVQDAAADPLPVLEMDSRQRVLQKLAEILSGVGPLGKARQAAVAVEAAANAVNPAQNDSRAYMNKARQLIANLKKNAELSNGILTGTLEPAQFVSMDAAEMATAEMRMQRDKTKEDAFQSQRSDYLQENDQKFRESVGVKNSGSEYVCSRCKSDKTRYYSMQTRSADEPMTVFVTCLNCMKRWKTV